MNDLTSTFKTVLLWAAAAVAVPVIVLIVVNLMPKKGKKQMNRTAEELLLKLKQLPVIDTHEHFAPEQYLQSDGIHFFTLLAPYVCDNMFSAGMTPEEWAMLQTPQVSFSAKTEILANIFPLSNIQPVFRVLDQMLRNGYALQDYSESEIFRVNQLIQKENTLNNFHRFYKALIFSLFLHFCLLIFATNIRAIICIMYLRYLTFAPETGLPFSVWRPVQGKPLFLSLLF